MAQHDTETRRKYEPSIERAAWYAARIRERLERLERDSVLRFQAARALNSDFCSLERMLGRMPAFPLALALATRPDIRWVYDWYVAHPEGRDDLKRAIRDVVDFRLTR